MEVEKEAPPSLLVALLSVHLLPCPPPDLATTVAVEKAGSEGKVEVEVKAVALLPSPSSSPGLAMRLARLRWMRRSALLVAVNRRGESGDDSPREGWICRRRTQEQQIHRPLVGFGRADPPPAGSRAMDPPSRVVERRRKGGPAPGVATKITVATCGLESGGSTTGGLRNGGSIASKLGSGGYVLASGGEEAEGQRRTGSGDQDHSG
ncbi:hypothetical protein OsI_12274 [Oryza sativa Indica Group]|uniref:Uncharacterized protein n=2 Tax=Oryza TaxID=4527 RepID=B8AKT9_ORYSI|nr:hypothetical protein OsI_12274 [Oryza sativa Indica Group]